MLNADQARIKEALSAFIEQSKANQSLIAQQRSAFMVFLDNYVHSLHKHHHREEAIVFSYLSDVKRVQLDTKLSIDHKTINLQIDTCTALAELLASPSSEGTATASSDVDILAQLIVSLCRCIYHNILLIKFHPFKYRFSCNSKIVSFKLCISGSFCCS